MNKKEVIQSILEHYYDIKTDTMWSRTAYGRGYLCAVRYILIDIYGFKQNDKRF